MDFLQDVDLVSGTRWDPEVVETALDRATAERQQLKEKLDRAVVVDIAATTTQEALLESIYAARDTAVDNAASALNSANAAAASATAAASAVDAFDDLYLGVKASDPTTDNDGNALQVGALYWNTADKKMRVWDGSSWQSAAGPLVGNADTATKLQTARTITIGNTGKSFDGSADVSWSLAEIGAAGFGILADGTDLNKVVSSGFYRLGNPVINAPAGVSWGQLIVARGGSDSILQIVTGFSNGEIYWRQGNPPDVGGSGLWSPWYRFFHSGNLDYAPPGMVAYIARNTAPSGWLKANGAAVSRTTYAALFAAIGTAFGAGDGSTTFNLPDLRGEFLRGWDDGRGVDSGRAFGTVQLDAMQGHGHANRSFRIGGTGGTGEFLGANDRPGDEIRTGRITTPVSDGINGTPRTAAETRPRNFALLACIKY
jgi:phage-related tail fiber protein